MNIYQVYPLTAAYAKGSKSDPFKGAYGNLLGIVRLADYIKKLGVDAIWVNPFFCWNKTGMTYDITDYTKVDPMFGTEDDFKLLCRTYHEKGIKVIIDMVFNHCSQEHEWFKASCNPNNKDYETYKDYFIWHSGKKDSNGKPISPNNWHSTWDSSGTSAWTWCEKRGQYYLHSFDTSMPNLNINNEVVQNRLLKICEQWFDLGADGFRLDAIPHYGCDSEFRDNPEDVDGNQIRMYDLNQGYDFVSKIRELANSYDQHKLLLGEAIMDKGEIANKAMKDFMHSDVCDMFFTGALNGKIEDFDSKIQESLGFCPQEKLVFALGSHDVERYPSRLWGEKQFPKQIKVAFSFLTKLPGSICIFQGDELGLANPKNFEKCKNPDNDPREVWKDVSMPWDAARGGFCLTETSHDGMAFVPSDEQKKLCVENQKKNPNSVLNDAINCLKDRKQNTQQNDWTQALKELVKVVA